MPVFMQVTPRSEESYRNEIMMDDDISETFSAHGISGEWGVGQPGGGGGGEEGNSTNWRLLQLFYIVDL
jgi:hypothetical protein